MESYAKLDIITPRYLSKQYVEDKGYTQVLEALERGKWFEFLGKEVPYIQEDLIRIFYANMWTVTSPEEGQDDRVYTKINGMEIEITDELIHEVSGLSHALTREMAYDEVQFLKSLGVTPKGNQTTIAGMDPQYRFLLYLVHYNILPRFSSRSKITQHDSFVMFNFLNNPQFNWCKLIKGHMVYVGKDLGYAPLIMDLLKFCGIQTSIPKMITPRTANWEITDTTFKNQSDPSIASKPRDALGKSKVTMKDLAKALMSITKSQKSMHKDIRKIRDKVDHMEDFMHNQWGYERLQNQEPSQEEDNVEEDDENEDGREDEEWY